MKKMTSRKDGKTRVLSAALQILCIVAVMAAAVLVRSPSSAFRGDAADVREAYTDETGIPYLTDMDSYYHVRLVRNYLENGTLGDTTLEDGTSWDSLRYAPEGRATDYPPGLIWLTATAWRIFGGSLEALEYRLAAILSAVSALAAYLIGRRLGGAAGGVTAGLLVGCAPTYALRTCFGRFDTDVLAVLMEVLLILFLTEALRSRTGWKRGAHAAGFVLTTIGYALCWMPSYSMLFVGLTLAGGMAAAIVLALVDVPERPRTAGAFFRRPGIWVVPGCGALTACGLLITCGPEVFGQILSSLGFSTTSRSGEGVLPNLFASISELSRASFFPQKAGQAFLGYVAGESTSTVNGVGGLAALLAAMAGLACLVMAWFPQLRERLRLSPAGDGALYACVLGAWMAAGLFLTMYGVRFLEHLSIPVGLLAGAFVGQAVRWTEAKAANQKWGAIKSFFCRKLIPVLLCAALLIPALTGTVRSVADSRPSATDASANAMRFVRESSQEEKAVVASWWDMGYFYENASGHPCLWDGGSQGGARAILVSKALITDDLELSRRILLMLAASGDDAVTMLRAHTDAKTAFEAVWEALLLEREAAIALLQADCGLSEAEAEEAEALLHPAQPRETWLVITYTMTQQMGWFEYYANWDFTGTQSLPSSTLYSYTPEGTPLFNTEGGQAYLDSVRGKEAMWQLFFAAVNTPCFTPAYEWHDGLEHVRIWRVEP